MFTNITPCGLIALGISEYNFESDYVRMHIHTYRKYVCLYVSREREKEGRRGMPLKRVRFTIVTY